MKPEVFLPALMLALASWLLFRAFVYGKIPGVQTLKGTLEAKRDETPVLFWLFTAGHMVLWLFALAALLGGLFPKFPSIWSWL